MKFSNLRKFRPGKTGIVLGVALCIGGVAAFAARSYLTGQIQAIEARTKGRLASVVVAKHDLTKGEKLSTANLAVREIPAEYAHSVGVTPDQFERINGQALAFPVRGGETILWALLEAQKAPTFSARVESGHRAMTVAVDEINSISGMIEPGDTIDLIVTIDQGGKRVTYPLLQRVSVMATGQRSVDDPKSGERRQYSTVTLDTTPAQAQNFIVAREAGKLTALLRNPQDKEIVGIAARAGAASPLARANFKTRHEIPVIYGGNLAKLSPDALRLGQAAAARDGAQQPGLPFVPAGAAAVLRP